MGRSKVGRPVCSSSFTHFTSLSLSRVAGGSDEWRSDDSRSAYSAPNMHLMNQERTHLLACCDRTAMSLSNPILTNVSSTWLLWVLACLTICSGGSNTTIGCSTSARDPNEVAFQPRIAIYPHERSERDFGSYALVTPYTRGDSRQTSTAGVLSAPTASISIPSIILPHWRLRI